MVVFKFDENDYITSEEWEENDDSQYLLFDSDDWVDFIAIGQKDSFSDYTSDIDIYLILNMEQIEDELGMGRDSVSQILSDYPNCMSFVGTLTYPDGELDTDNLNGGNNNTPTPSNVPILNLRNKTVSSLYIHNKEVQSIITSNSAVLYRKSNVTPVINVDSVSLVSDKSILSYYHSESATLSATVLDSNSSPVESATVEFFKGSTSLGTATTNSNGVATMSYNATGVGDVSFTATCYNVSSNAEIVEDCIRYSPNEEILTNATTITICEITSNTPNYAFTFEYYPTNTWEWVRINGGGMPQTVLSSSYDKGSNFGLTSLGYNKYVPISFIISNGTETVSSGSKTATQSVSPTYPYDLTFYPNKTNNKIKNLKVKAL